MVTTPDVLLPAPAEIAVTEEHIDQVIEALRQGKAAHPNLVFDQSTWGEELVDREDGWPNCRTAACVWGSAYYLAYGRPTEDGPPPTWANTPRRQAYIQIFRDSRLEAAHVIALYDAVQDDGTFDLDGVSLRGIQAWGFIHLYGSSLWRANLDKARLDGAVFDRAQCSEITLSEALLRRASFVGASLFRANMRRANLMDANLSGADLGEANLRHASLYHADLSSAVLVGADLSHADLRTANLTHADLTSADLTYADLRGAVLVGTDLAQADLTGARFDEAERPDSPTRSWGRSSSTSVVPHGRALPGGFAGRVDAENLARIAARIAGGIDPVGLDPDG